MNNELKKKNFHQIETIYSPKLYNPVFWIVLILKIRRFHPHILWLHGNRAIFCCSMKWLRFFIGRHIKLVGTTHNERNRLFHRLDKIIAITRHLKKNLIKEWGIEADKIIVCPNAVAPVSSGVLPDGKGPVCIVFLRRLEPVKGCDLLIRACLLLKQQGVPFRLLIAGDGSQRLYYENLCHQYDIDTDVSFMGWIQDKTAFFKEVDMMYFPSKSEGLPVSLIESCSFRKPVIVTSCPGMVEVVSYLGCGEIVDIDDVSGLADTLRLLIQHPHRCHLLAERSYKTFMDMYHIDIQKKILLKAVLNLMEEAS